MGVLERRVQLVWQELRAAELDDARLRGIAEATFKVDRVSAVDMAGDVLDDLRPAEVVVPVWLAPQVAFADEERRRTMVVLVLHFVPVEVVALELIPKRRPFAGRHLGELTERLPDLVDDRGERQDAPPAEAHRIENPGCVEVAGAIELEPVDVRAEPLEHATRHL